MHYPIVVAETELILTVVEHNPKSSRDCGILTVISEYHECKYDVAIDVIKELW